MTPEDELQRDLDEIITITKRDFLDMTTAMACSYFEIEIHLVEQIRDDLYHHMNTLLELRNDDTIIKSTTYKC